MLSLLQRHGQCKQNFAVETMKSPFPLHKANNTKWRPEISWNLIFVVVLFLVGLGMACSLYASLCVWFWEATLTSGLFLLRCVHVWNVLVRGHLSSPNPSLLLFPFCFAFLFWKVLGWGGARRATWPLLACHCLFFACLRGCASFRESHFLKVLGGYDCCLLWQLLFLLAAFSIACCGLFHYPLVVAFVAVTLVTCVESLVFAVLLLLVGHMVVVVCFLFKLDMP